MLYSYNQTRQNETIQLSANEEYMLDKFFAQQLLPMWNSLGYTYQSQHLYLAALSFLFIMSLLHYLCVFKNTKPIRNIIKVRPDGRLYFDVESFESIQEECNGYKQKTKVQKLAIFANDFIASYEEIFRGNRKIFPHYKYVAFPLYKKFGGNKYPLISTPLTFLAMNFLFHKMPGVIFNYLYYDKITLNHSILDRDMAGVFLMLSAPIAVRKHFANSHRKLKI